MTSRMLLEYDGTDFAGWARQPGQRAVQDEVERALCTVLRKEDIALVVAGRTDRGVHAWAQVCSYHTRFARTVHSAEWRADGDLLELWITADTFMRSMNRILVGTMLEVATGRRSLEDFSALLQGAPRAQTGPTAPPHGLALARLGCPPAG